MDLSRDPLIVNHMSDSSLGYKPNIDDVLSLRTPEMSKASPSGCKVAYTVRSVNFDDNRFENHCFIYDRESCETFQLTRKGSVTGFDWIDDRSLAVLKTVDELGQVYLYEGLIGEGLQLTDHEKGVESFKPFAGGILYIADNPERKNKEKRKEKYGVFSHYDQEISASALYYTSIERRKEYLISLKAAPSEKPVKPLVELSQKLPEPLKITSIYPSPEGDTVYINCRSKDPLIYGQETSSYKLSVDPEKALSQHLKGKDGDNESYLGEILQLNLPKGASISAVSPDGSMLLIRHKERDIKSYTQADYWILKTNERLDGELAHHLQKITGDLDQSATAFGWTDAGVFLSYSDSTKTNVSLINTSGVRKVLDLEGIYPVQSIHVNLNGYISFAGTNAEKYPEIYVSSEPVNNSKGNLIKITGLGCQVEGWDLGTVETIRWKSKDGTMIEGVLRKPSDYDPGKRYPLAFIVHGGPSAASKEYLGASASGRYPGIQFVNRDILTLMPNYRGSVGRGQAFQELNVDNLGIGDLWDIESVIDHLDAEGVIDPANVVCMGWSQGGYISAMATTHSTRFKAVSVGAGISDWYTYHISTDIPHFTVDYLSGSPFRDRSIYVKTSPMTKIQEAKTPTLIQHGAKDNRVPFSDATELYRGLKEMGVQVELFVYPEMAHGITKPKETRAVLEQNLTWFLHHLYGEELKFPE